MYPVLIVPFGEVAEIKVYDSLLFCSGHVADFTLLFVSERGQVLTLFESLVHIGF